jgi:hypothetical protein
MALILLINHLKIKNKMKRILFSLIIPVLVLSGCNQYEYNEPARQLKVIESALDFNANAGSGYILLESNAALSATSSAGWCMTQVDGKKINISVTANSDIENRTAMVRIRANGDSINVPVTQQSAIFMVDNLSFAIKRDAANLKTCVVSDKPISVSSESSWITATFVQDTIFLSVSENTSTVLREGKIKVTSGAISQYIVVKQERGLELTAQISISNLNPVTADITITPSAGVSAYAVLVASKELYQEFVDIYTDGDEVAFMGLLGDLYETSDPITETFELNGSTGYDYYAVVLLYDSNGEPSSGVIKREFTSPAYQAGLPEASVSIAVSDITATSARVVITPDANALGFYEGIFAKASYDAAVAQEGEDYIKNYLSIYGYLSFTAVDDIWSLNPATEYIAVAAPFNANGTDGYGDLVTQAFTTPGGSGDAITVRSTESMVQRERKPYKKAVTAETIKMLNPEKKK